MSQLAIISPAAAAIPTAIRVIGFVAKARPITLVATVAAMMARRMPVKAAAAPTNPRTSAGLAWIIAAT
ncbi:hypothetical protein D3C77_749780 [compost metagenome]